MSLMTPMESGKIDERDNKLSTKKTSSGPKIPVVGHFEEGDILV